MVEMFPDSKMMEAWREEWERQFHRGIDKEYNLAKKVIEERFHNDRTIPRHDRDYYVAIYPISGRYKVVILKDGIKHEASISATTDAQLAEEIYKVINSLCN